MARHSLRAATAARHDARDLRGEDGPLLAVSTRGLTKRFDDKAVVDQLALAIPAGSVCGFVGPNGAGKTTTIRMLLGLIRPSAGPAGARRRPQRSGQLPQKVGALIEAPAFYPRAAGGQPRVLAVLGRHVRPIDDCSTRSAWPNGRRPYRSYSLGMKQRLGIAAALLVNPSCWCSTSRPTGSTRAASSRCGHSSDSWPMTASRSSCPATCLARSSTSATTWS